MISSSGVRCDVCDQYIFGLTEEDYYYNFKLSCFSEVLQHCSRCRAVLVEMFEKKDLSVLPDGRLRKGLEKAFLETSGDVTWGVFNPST